GQPWPAARPPGTAASSPRPRTAARPRCFSSPSVSETSRHLSGASTPANGSGGLTELVQGGGERGAQPAGGAGRQVRDEPVPGATLLLDGQHDARVAGAARVAVVRHRDRPGHRWALVLAGGMVVNGVVDRFAHPSPIRGRATASGRPGRGDTSP